MPEARVRGPSGRENEVGRPRRLGSTSMVGVTVEKGPGPPDLFRDDDPHQGMREGEAGQRPSQLRPLKARGRQAVRPAREQGGVAPFRKPRCEPLGELRGGPDGAVLVEGDDPRPGRRRPQQPLPFPAHALRNVSALARRRPSIRDGHFAEREPAGRGEAFRVIPEGGVHPCRHPGSDRGEHDLHPPVPHRLAGRRRDLLLLTATPVNNSLWDLYHLLRYFLRQDAHFADRGILSIRQRFERAMHEDPSSLGPDLLYPIIDATTVKRTRQFVKKHYGGDTIPGPDGAPRPIVFPRPKAIAVRYGLDDLLPGFFDRLERALDPDAGPDADETLSFARYAPNDRLRERGDEDETGRGRALAALLRSGLLKRFESSAFAFRRTVEKMAAEHTTFLRALDAGRVVTTAFMREISADDDEDTFDAILAGTEHSVDAALYDAAGLRAAVARDRAILLALAGAVAEITPGRDPKLRALADALAKIAGQAERDAVDAGDEAQKRKVLVFSYFADTVEWIRRYLGQAFEARPELAVWRGRMAAVGGADAIDGVSRHAAALGFAPVTMEAPEGRNADLYDLLISTDVLAEGANLQQCRHVVNFDVPWNPMRLVQRHGRIDRIGSPHDRVFMRTIFPADRLDRLLDLERRILEKLARAAASVGVAAPIPGAARGGQVFTETRREIERLLAEDASLYECGGAGGAAQTGEEYRQTLRKALAQDRERILSMPWKAGSGMVRGARRGIFFCAVVGRESSCERTFLRFVAGGADWRPAAGGGAIERELGACLRLIECEPETPAWFPEALAEAVYDFWDAARADILCDWTRETDPANLQPAVRALNRRVAAHIRAHPPSGMEGRAVERALDILESPWPRREEVMLRGWYAEPAPTRAAHSAVLVGRVLETGLEPARPPRPLPPIEPGDIELLCWMGVEAEAASAASPVS